MGVVIFSHYPKLSLIGLSYIAVICLIIVLGPDYFHDFVVPFGIGGMFVAGMLYTYSFTAGLGAIFLVSFLGDHSSLMIAIIGGVGAAFADVSIFRLVRSDLKREINRIASKKVFQGLVHHHLFRRTWIRDVIGLIIIASPFPDELGIAIMASTKLKEENFAMLTFIVDAIGIYLLVEAVSFFL